MENVKDRFNHEYGIEHYKELKSLINERGIHFYEKSLSLLKIRIGTRIGFVRSNWESGHYELVYDGSPIWVKLLWNRRESSFFNGDNSTNKFRFFHDLYNDKECLSKFAAVNRMDDELTYNQRFYYVFQITKYLVRALLVDYVNEFSCILEILSFIEEEHPQIFRKVMPVLRKLPLSLPSLSGGKPNTVDYNNPPSLTSLSLRQYYLQHKRGKRMNLVEEFFKSISRPSDNIISNRALRHTNHVIQIFSKSMILTKISADVLFYHIFSFLDEIELLKMTTSSKLFLENIWNRSLRNRKSKSSFLFFHLFEKQEIVGDSLLHKFLKFKVIDEEEVFIFTFPHLFELDYEQTLNHFSQSKFDNFRVPVCHTGRYFDPSLYREYKFEGIMENVSNFRSYLSQKINTDQFWKNEMVGLLRFFLYRHPNVCFPKRLCKSLFKSIRCYTNEKYFLRGLELIHKVYIVNCSSEEQKERRKSDFLIFYTSVCRKGELFRIGFEWVLKNCGHYYDEKDFMSISKKVVIENWAGSGEIMEACVTKLSNSFIHHLFSLSYSTYPNCEFFKTLLHLFPEYATIDTFKKALISISKRKFDEDNKIRIFNKDELGIVEFVLKQKEIEIDYSMEDDLLLRTFSGSYKTTEIIFQFPSFTLNHEVIWNLFEQPQRFEGCNDKFKNLLMMVKRPEIPYDSMEFCTRLSKNFFSLVNKEKYTLGLILAAMDIFKILLENEDYMSNTRKSSEGKDALNTGFMELLDQEYKFARIQYAYKAEAPYQPFLYFYYSYYIQPIPTDTYFRFLDKMYYCLHEPTTNQINQIFVHFCRSNNIKMIVKLHDKYKSDILEENLDVSKIISFFRSKSLREKIYLCDFLGACTVFATKEKNDDDEDIPTMFICYSCSICNNDDVPICFSCSQNCHKECKQVVKRSDEIETFQCMCNECSDDSTCKCLKK